MFYIDLGSSTIKTYAHSNALELAEENSIYFKNNFTRETGISDKNMAALMSYFSDLKSRRGLGRANTRIFATGIFRDIPDAQLDLLKTAFDGMDLDFNVISHEREGFYLQKAAEMDYAGKKCLIINMGGKTTELVSAERGGAMHTKLLNVGVADLLNKFPEVNEKYSAIAIQDMEDFVLEKIKDIDFDTDYDFALFTGELRFEKLSGYPLISNTMFVEPNHPYMVTLDGFIRGTRRIFFDLSMDDLYALMPSNPKWMDGARPGAVLPLALFRRANISVVVPSDLNLINGVVNSGC